MKRTLAFLLLLVPLSASAQWTKTASALLGAVSQNIGAMTHVGQTVWAANHDVWKSTDGGMTWTKSLTNTASVAHIYFLDLNNGLVTTHGGVVYQTTDGGSTWSTLLTLSNASSAVFVGSTKNILVSAFSPGVVHYSHDGGATWGSVSNNNWIREIVPWKNNTAYLLSGDWSTREHIWISTDLGVTWNQQPGMVDADSYSFDIGLSCDSIAIYVSNEEYSITAGYDGRSQLFVSYDLGNTWNCTSSHPSKYFAGSVSVGAQAVYCQTVSEINAGSLRSTDHGLSWTGIGGPAASGDTRLISALDDNHIVAVGIDGSIWVTLNSGGDSVKAISNGSYPTLLAHTFSTISACIDTSIYDYLSIGCSQFRLDSIKLLDTAGVFRLDSKQVVPRLVDFNKSDSVHLIFHPNGRGGVFGARVHLYGTVVGGAAYDTVLTLVASSVANGSPLPTVTASPFGLVTSCTDGDGYAFVRVGCTQFRIDSAKIEQDTAGVFHLDPFLKLPLVVDGNKSDTLHVIFHPNHKIGGFGARLHLFGTSASTGLPYDTVITLLAGSTPAPPNFYSTAYQVLWNMPECSDADTTITYVNKGCDSILVDSLRLAQGVTLTSQGLTLPKKIAPNGSITLRVHFSPQGLKGDSLNASLFYSSPGFHDSIHVPVYAQPQPSPPNLSANHTSINFGTVPSCRTLDTTIVLKNTGCDSLTIESLSNIGSGFPIDSASLPITLAKGESDTIRIRYHPQTSSDLQTITVHTTHGNKTGITTINLAGHLSITTLSVASEPIDLSATAICGSADTAIAISNPGCDTITITAADLSPSGDIQLSGLSLPIILLPGKDTVLRIHFAADHQEYISSMLSLEYHIRDLFQDKIQIPITANATAPQENVQLSGNALDLQQWQICVSSLLHLRIENQSCDTLIFYAKDVVGDSDFRIVKGLDTASLAPKETTQIDLSLKPQAKGHRSAMVHVLYWNKNKSSGIHDSLIALAADITNGTAHMQSSIPSAQLGTLNLCSIGDTTISIHNTGCDTLIVNSGSLDNRYFILSPAGFPYHIPPDSTVTWHVTTDMDTTGRPSSLSSALSFTSTNADNTLPPIPLSYNIRYADPLALKLAPLTTRAKNDTAIYYDIRYPANLASYGVNEVVFNMHADANLFDYVMNQSSNTVTESSTVVNGIQNYRFDVTGSPIQQDVNGTIAKIWFKTYLSLTTHTNVSIDSIRLNPSDPDFEKCIAFTTVGADTTFDLATVCGDNLFQQAMAGDKLTLRVVEQDGEPIVYIHSPMNGVAHVLISNVLGVPVYSEDIELVKGDRQYRFDRPDISEPLFLTISDDLGERALGRLITIR